MKKKTQKQYAPSRKEMSKRSGEHTSRFAPDWWELEGKGLAKLRICRSCHAVYFDKHWHTWARVKQMAEKLRRLGVREDTCAECRWSADAKRGDRGYEGEVMLTGWQSADDKRELLAIARNIGVRATKRDPQDQIIAIQDQGTRVRILTTENQLAISIGKQIDRARKGGKLEIRFSHGDAPVRVRWQGK